MLAVLGLLAALFVPRRRMWVKASADGSSVRIEYAGLARGEDPTLGDAVERMAAEHLAAFTPAAGRGDDAATTDAPKTAKVD